MNELLQRLLKKFLAYGAILLLVCLSFEYILYNNTQNHFFVRQTDWHLKHPQPIQVLFLGNSRTGAQIYLPSIIKKWQVPMYNLSLYAGAMEEVWLKYSVFAKRNTKPKVIVLQFDPAVFLSKKNIVDTFINKERFLSYLFLNNLGLNHWLEGKYGYDWYDAYIPLVRYIPYPALFLKHLSNQSLDPYTFPYEEYPRLNAGNMVKNADPINDISKWPIFQRALDLQYADSFYYYCKKNNIQLACIYPPQSKLSYDKMKATYKNKIQTYLDSHPDILYHDFNTTEFEEDSLYRNHLHLNMKGVELYTQRLEAWLELVGIRSQLQPAPMQWKY